MGETIKPTSIDMIVHEINMAFGCLIDGELLFEQTHTVLRDDIENEAALYNNIDYFYGLFYERGYNYLDYIVQKMAVYFINANDVKKTINLIRTLRTYKSHTLNHEKPRDKAIIDSAEKWYFANAGAKHPKDGDVKAAEFALCKQVKETLKSILICVRSINGDGRKTEISAELLAIKFSSFPDYILEGICSDVINKLEIKIDSHAIIKNYGSQIRERLKCCKLETKEAGKKAVCLCIEDILFSEQLTLFPLSSDRIKDAYGISNGKRLGELRKIAKELYNRNIFLSADELLDELILKVPVD